MANAPRGRQLVKSILVENRLNLGPNRGKGSWNDCLRIHADMFWQIDFFSKNAWTLQGPRQVFALAFIGTHTRRVFVTVGSVQPDSTWMAANADSSLEREQFLVEPRSAKIVIAVRVPPQ